MQMGLSLETEIELTEDLEKLENSLSIDDIAKSSFSSSNRIEHKLLEQSITLGDLDKQRYKASSLPSVVGFYQNQKSTLRSEFNFFQSNLPSTDTLPLNTPMQSTTTKSTSNKRSTKKRIWFWHRRYTTKQI
ncbi:MAG: hypothetical protein NTZ00_07430 [Bacteroidetes bacterium]|nr:hypothetical protein [Bacteroidota bacterium]